MDLKGTAIIAGGVLLGLLVGAGTLVVILRGPRATPSAAEPGQVQYQVMTVSEGDTVVVVVVAVPAPPAAAPNSTEPGPKRKGLPRPATPPPSPPAPHPLSPW